MTRTIIMTLAATMLGGCVAGQSLSYDYKPAAATEKASGAVDVVVLDERPYVKDGDKDANYVGHYRAGFGNTWDITTKGGKPLATILAEDLREELDALGFTAGKGGRTLQVEIRDWNMDTYLNAKFWYELLVSVVDPSGKSVLPPQTIKEEKRIDGSFWVGPKYAVEKQMPALYDEVVLAIGRNNPAVRDALATAAE